MDKLREIFVYNKENKDYPIAKFDNDSVYKSEEALSNVLSAPTMHLELGKIATLTFDILSTSEKWQLVNHPEYEWHCDGRVFTMNEENSVTYTGEVVNATVYEIGNLLKYEYAQIHNVDTQIEALDEHTIKILPRTVESLKLTINGTQYNDSDVVDSRGVVMPRGSAGYALWAILKASRNGWRLGVCDLIADNFDASKDLGTQNLESDKEDLLTNIEHIVEKWGGVLMWDSKNKILHLRDESKTGSDFNAWKGFGIYEGKNLKEKPQIQVDNKIITKAYLLGNGDIHVKDVNGGKSYIENYSYTDRVYEGYLKNENIYYTGSESLSGQTNLLEWGRRELEKLSRPREVYLFSILDRRIEENFSHENFEIGDIVRIFFTNRNTGETQEVEKRIIDIQYDVFSIAEVSIMAGDKILNKQDIYELIYKNSAGSSVLPSWNGTFNAEDIIIDLSDIWSEYFGTGGYGYGSLSKITELYAEHITENTSAVAAVRVYADETFATVESFTDFQSWTENSFSESHTAINQVSSALSAQITLEASHYNEVKNSITNEIEQRTQSVANLKLYADGNFATIQSLTAYQQDTYNRFVNVSAVITQTTNSLNAQISLEASHYSELKNSINSTSQSLASFKVEASRNYASVSSVTQVSNNVASISATANANTSSINAIASRTADINGGRSILSMSPNDAILGFTSGTDQGAIYCYKNSVTIGATGSVTMGAVNGTVNINANTLRLDGREIYYSNGYVRYRT